MFETTDATDSTEPKDTFAGTEFEPAYDFIDRNGRQGSDDKDDEQVRRWRLGEHTMADDAVSGGIVEALNRVDEDVDGDLRQVLEEAAGMVSTSSVRGFECPVCGLNHSHSDHKHDIRSGFSVEDDFADQMEYVPYCHCGVNELGMLVDFFPYINTPVFTDQDQFEGVLEISPDALDDVYRKWSANGRRSVKAAAQASEYGYEVDPVLYPELKRYFERVRAIKSAADSAPIASETRQHIESTRETLEEQVNGE